jgi:integrase
MKQDQLAESTIKPTARRLRYLAKFVDLNKPSEVTSFLASKKGKNSYREALAYAYLRYVRYNGLEWSKPKIKCSSQPPYVPTDEEVTVLISDAGKKYSLILSILRDTGLRPIEVERMKFSWLDLNRGTINVQSAKYGNGRTLKLKGSTVAMLKEYLATKQYGLNDNIFPKTKTMRRAYTELRKRTASKLKRPELLKITLYSFRHYFATMLYHKTKDILHVKQQLGHKRLENTLVYTHLIDFRDEEFTVRAAKTVEEATQLIESGFEYICEVEEVKLFRKRK